MPILMITGTNTDVGKTVATAALAVAYRRQGWNVLAIKPVQTGEPAGSGDAHTVAALAGVEVAEFVRYPEPLAPNLAARRAGLPQADLGEIAARIRELDTPDRLLLVEGAGGLLVRLADNWTLADLAWELAAPMVVVTSTGLGSLNLAELTVRAAKDRGIEVAGVIGSRHPKEPDLAARLNIEEFPEVTGVPYLGTIVEGQRECLGQVDLQPPRVRR